MLQTEFTEWNWQGWIVYFIVVIAAAFLANRMRTAASKKRSASAGCEGSCDCPKPKIK